MSEEGKNNIYEVPSDIKERITGKNNSISNSDSTDIYSNVHDVVNQTMSSVLLT